MISILLNCVITFDFTEEDIFAEKERDGSARLEARETGIPSKHPQKTGTVSTGSAHGRLWDGLNDFSYSVCIIIYG